MNKISLLHKIQKLYENDNINIIQYLKEVSNMKQNTTEDIMISYDFQAGNYVDSYLKDMKKKEIFLSRLVNVFETLPGRKRTIFEPGVGEATTLVPFMNMLNREIFAGGGDISWSRIKTAQKFAQEYLSKSLRGVDLVMADMFSLPFADDSVDIVYTVHAMEPNGGHETELMQELYRITGEYLILLEPAYELAGMKERERMERNGYVRALYQTAKSLGYHILMWELYGESVNPMNPTGIMVIEKHPNKERTNAFMFSCPITKAQLEPIGNVYYSRDSLLAYPVINDVPCLMEEYAVVATKMMELA